MRQSEGQAQEMRNEKHLNTINYEDKVKWWAKKCGDF